MRSVILGVVWAILALPCTAQAYVTNGQGWLGSRVPLEVDPLVYTHLPDAHHALERASTAWRLPGVPTLHVDESEHSVLRRAGDGHNVVVVMTEDWPFSPMALATTVSTRNWEDNSMVEADIYINAQRYRFADSTQGAIALSDRDAPVLYDLQSVLTHELGHVLGLGDETSVHEATMFFTQAAGETHKRTLADDDIAGMDDLYRVARMLAEMGCQCIGSKMPAGGTWVALVLGLLVVALCRRALATRVRWCVSFMLVLWAGLALALKPGTGAPPFDAWVGLGAPHASFAVRGVVEAMEDTEAPGLPLPMTRLRLSGWACVAGPCSHADFPDTANEGITLWGGSLTSGGCAEITNAPLPAVGQEVLALVDNHGHVVTSHAGGVALLEALGTQTAIARLGPHPSAPHLPLPRLIDALRQALGAPQP